MPSNARFFISISGQSNALGTDSASLLTTTQPYDGLRQPGRPSTNDPTAVALIEAFISPNFNESPASALGNMVHEMDPLGRQVIVHNWAVGSTPYSLLAQGTTNYIFGQTGASNARTWIIANRTSETFFPAALVWIHGENDELDGVSAATYSGYMAELQADWQADMQALTGLSSRVPLILVQHAASAELNAPVSHMETAIGAWLASVNNTNTYLACPEYPLTWIANSPHLNAASARRLGRYIGRAFKRAVIDGSAWRPLQPSAISATNNIVTIDFVGGDELSDLVFDTSNMTRRGLFYGFDYSDGQSDIPAISSVALSGSRQVQLTLTRNAQAPARVTYGNYSVITADPGATQQMAAGGNLRDQDTTPSNDGDRALENWCVIFDRAVDSVSGTASGTAAFGNTQSFDSTGAARALLSARSLTTLDGLANCTIEFYFRTNAASWANANAMMAKVASSQRQFDIRTATGGLVRWFISTSLSDASNWYETSGYSAQTWYHMVFIKSGTTISVYRNGSLLSGTQTGTVPANMTSPTSDFQILNSNDSAPANQNMSHICLYQRALSAADVAERYNSGTPIDPRTLSTGGPVNYWPGQGTFEDLGSGTSRNLFSFGAISFEAIHP